MLLRPSGRGGSIGGLALEFEQDSTCITRMYTCMHAFPRSCIFVGDILLAVDNKEVHCAADLIEVLEELPAGAPITLMLRQPALRTALKERLTEKVRFAAWVKLQLPPGSALAASGSQGGGKETEHGAKVDSKLAEKRKAARLDEVLTLPSSRQEEEEEMEEEADAKQKAMVKAKNGGAAQTTEDGTMALLVLCGQRIRLVQLKVAGTRRGVLRPELTGTLEKQGEGWSLQKWRTRKFELRSGTLYYYDPEDMSKPKGNVPLSFRGVEVLSEGHKESADPLVIVVCTPQRNYCLRAPDQNAKDTWVDALRARVGRPEAPLRLLEVVTHTILEDIHLLDLYSLSSSDHLETSLTLTMTPGMSGSGAATTQKGVKGARLPVLSLSTPLARQAALQLQAAWQRLTTFLGVPLRGSERNDNWLQPRSELAALPMQPCDLVWRNEEYHFDAEVALSKRSTPTFAATSKKMGLMCGWMWTKPQTEDGVAWRHANVQKRFCVLTEEVLRCYKSEEIAQCDLAKLAKGEDGGEADDSSSPTPGGLMSITSPFTPGAASLHQRLAEAATTPVAPAMRSPPFGGSPFTPFTPNANAIPAASLALTTIEMCRVTRVRPCMDPSGASNAFELRTLGDGGHELTVVFEPPNSHEGSDSWLDALYNLLPAAAFEAPRQGQLGWNYFADPLLPHTTAYTHHPLAVMSPADELASALLTIADWRGISGCERAAAALRASTSGIGCASVDLCQRRGHHWSESELTLLLTALVHNTRVDALCLRGFALTGQTAKALAALLGRSACLATLELRGCTFDDVTLQMWTTAVQSNSSLPLRSLALMGCNALKQNCHPAGLCLSKMIKTLPSSLVDLELDGAGITGSALRNVLDALHRHDRRFFTVRKLQRLTLNSDTIDERNAQASLCALLRRTTGLKQLRLLPADRTRFRSSSTGLAPVLEALHSSNPPLESLAVDGCAVASGDELASLAILRVATRFRGLQQLSLGGTRMPVDALCAVVAILVHNASRPPLALDCARNKLGNVGGLKLAAVLRGATSLKSLEAADNEFGPGAITALAEALRGVTSLVELGLARNVRTPPYRRPAEMKPRDQQALTEDNDEEGSVLEGDHDGINDGSYANADARRAFRAIGALLSDRRCSLRVLDIGGDTCGYAVADELPPLLLNLARCKTLTSADVSGHSAGSSPGVLGALLHLLRRSRSLRHLNLCRNGFDSASLRAILGGWRRRNLTLQRLTLFAADPREASHGRGGLPLDTAVELMDEAEQLSRRNRRLAEAMERELSV